MRTPLHFTALETDRKSRPRQIAPLYPSPPSTREADKVQKTLYSLQEAALPNSAKYLHTHVHRPPWLPVWLRRWFLALFTVTCGVLVAGLLILFLLSKKNQGIALVTTNHYTWTYAPTVILVLAVAVWRQVDFHIKSLAPWEVLAQAGGEACKTILLDYISPIQITSFYDAIKNKHHRVTLGVAGFFFLKLAALASTGLLLPVPTQLNALGSALTKTATFNGNMTRAADSSTLEDTSLLYEAYGITIKGLAAPDGIHNGMVFGPFKLADAPAQSNANVTAEVNALIPKYRCESAPVQIILQPPNSTDEHPEDIIQMTFPECTMPDNFTGRSAYALNPQTFLTPPRQLSPVMQPIKCFDGKDNWQLITLTDFRYAQDVNTSEIETFGDSVQASSWETTVNRTTSIACRSTYAIYRINVTYEGFSDHREISVGPPILEQDSKLEGLTESDLGRLFTASLAAASDMFGNVLEGAYAEEYPQTMTKFMAALGDGTYESLFDEATMIERAEKVFEAVAVQIMHKYFMQNASENVVGKIRSSNIRLHVNELSLWVMVAGFSITLLVGIWLLVFPPKHTIPRNPEPVTTMALVLAHSRRAQTIFQHSNSEGSMKSLKHYRYSAKDSVTNSEGYELLVAGTQEISPDLREDVQLSWWKPIFIQRYMYLTTLALPLLCCGTLQVLQQFSDRDNGFARVDDSDSLGVRFCTRYLPALILLLVASMINSVDFNIAVLAPYQALRRGWMTADGPLSEPILGKTPPKALLTLIKHRNWGPLLSSLSSLLGSLLAVVVSGLYVVEGISSSSLTTAPPFSLASSKAPTFHTPLFTYEDIALPTLRVATEASASLPSSIGVSATVSVQVSALRAKLDCTALAPSFFNTTARYSSITGPSAFIEVSAPLPPQCLLGGPNGTLPTLDFTQTFQFPFAQNASLIGKLLDLHVGPFDEITMSSSDEIAATSQQDNPAGCPSIALIWGYVDVTDSLDQDTHAVTVMVCNQHLESTPTELTLTYPDLLIPSSSPPKPDIQKAELIPASTDGGETEYAFQFRPQLHFDRKLALFHQEEFDSSNSARIAVDPVFQAVLFGRKSVDRNAFAAVGDSEREQVLQGVNGVYGRYMAQAISSNMRGPLPTTDTAGDGGGGEVFEATLTAPYAVLRVKQNATSKVILQVLLGLMVLCMAAAIKITKMKETLMFNPCCVGGVAALWAGSEVCQEGSLDRRRIREGGGELDGWEFRLAWCGKGQDGEGVRRWGIESRWVGSGQGDGAGAGDGEGGWPNRGRVEYGQAF